jgi:hypothetical protein
MKVKRPSLGDRLEVFDAHIRANAANIPLLCTSSGQAHSQLPIKEWHTFSQIARELNLTLCQVSRDVKNPKYGLTSERDGQCKRMPPDSYVRYRHIIESRRRQETGDELDDGKEGVDEGVEQRMKAAREAKERQRSPTKE